MADSSKVFRLAEGMKITDVGEAIISYLSSDHNMYAEGTTTPEGYFLQAKTQDSGWKKLAGMSKATQVQIIGNDDLITVSVGSGEWSDKVGAGVVGAIVFAPLMFTAAFGAWEQKKLVEQIFTFVQNYIASGGRSVVVTSTPIDHGDVVECPSCKAKNTPDKKFCNECGAPLSATCPSCGKPVAFGAKFCGECGKPVA